MKKFFLVFITVFSIFTYSLFGSESNIKLVTKSGYKANAIYYNDDDSKDIMFILLHGKSGNIDNKYRVKTYKNLYKKDYEVLAAKMPWSKDWEGTLEDGLELIDSAINFALEKNKKPVLVGHSLGGNISLIYASKNPNKNLLGVITVAPGHMIHQSRKSQEVSKKSLEKAKKMISENKGNEKADFKMLNTGKVKKEYIKAKIFDSYYNLETFPNIMDTLEKVKIPVLWIAGDDDRLTSVYAMEDKFFLIPDNDLNEYIQTEGNHRSVLKKSTQIMINWSEKLKK